MPSTRKDLFVEDAFRFDFTDDMPVVEAGDEPAEDATAQQLVGVTKGASQPATQQQVEAAVTACAGSGWRFLAVGSKSDWADLRQRHRDCVVRALRKVQKERAARAASRKAGKRRRGADESSSSEDD
jgi:hypothetical protein